MLRCDPSTSVPCKRQQVTIRLLVANPVATRENSQATCLQSRECRDRILGFLLRDFWLLRPNPRTTVQDRYATYSPLSTIMARQLEVSLCLPMGVSRIRFLAQNDFDWFPIRFCVRACEMESHVRVVTKCEDFGREAAVFF